MAMAWLVHRLLHVWFYCISAKSSVSFVYLFAIPCDTIQITSLQNQCFCAPHLNTCASSFAGITVTDVCLRSRRLTNTASAAENSYEWMQDASRTSCSYLIWLVQP